MEKRGVLGLGICDGVKSGAEAGEDVPHMSPTPKEMRISMDLVFNPRLDMADVQTYIAAPAIDVVAVSGLS